MNKTIKTAEEILQKAIRSKTGRRAEGYIDNKAFIYLDDFLTLLIQPESKIVRLNGKASRVYLHEVVYEGHLFQAITKNELNFSKYQKN